MYPTIEVTNDAWSGLNQLKEPGDTFDDVIRRLLHLAGASIDQPDKDENYVAGDVVLTRNEYDDRTVLRPSLITRSKRTEGTGDYEAVPLSRLEWGAGSTRPRARSYLPPQAETLNYNSDKIVQLDEAPQVEDNET